MQTAVNKREAQTEVDLGGYTLCYPAKNTKDHVPLLLHSEVMEGEGKGKGKGKDLEAMSNHQEACATTATRWSGGREGEGEGDGEGEGPGNAARRWFGAHGR